MTRTVGIYLFDQVEVLDFAGPYEVFSTASRVSRRSEPAREPPFRVVTIANEQRTINARGDLKIMPDHDLNTAPSLDVLIVPGGPIDRVLEDLNLMRWIRARAAEAEIVASVCTGSFLLAKAGLLDGKRGTTHWEDLEEFQSMFPEVEVKGEVRWVEQGKVFTSAGISAGLDMSLRIVARLEGEPLALRTARQMEYIWNQA